MLQRIQTVYLLLASAASCSIFSLPFFKGVSSDGASFFSDGVFNIQDHISLMAMTTLTVLNAILAIFLFKNRPRQRVFTLVVIASNLMLLAVIFGVLTTQVSFSEIFSKFHLGFGLLMPLIAIVFAFLAQRGILADERLVRSSDRLR